MHGLDGYSIITCLPAAEIHNDSCNKPNVSSRSRVYTGRPISGFITLRV